jgi:hypothetical protein
MSMKRAPVVNRPLSKAKNGTSLNITITPSKNLQVCETNASTLSFLPCISAYLCAIRDAYPPIPQFE